MEISDAELQQLIGQQGGAGGLEQSQMNQLAAHTSNSIFAQNQDSNLIMWQLELDNILERIEHLLKGNELIEDEKGNSKYVSPTDKSLIILNGYGVKLVMNIISFYLNRNTILSNYSEERIYEILYDLGMELADLIYINYDKMGMDSVQKRSRYQLLVMSILNTIESAYNRSLDGGERNSLRSARMVTQTENPSANNNQMQMPRKQRGFLGNMFNP